MEYILWILLLLFIAFSNIKLEKDFWKEAKRKLRF